jgi:16S rRNA (guanine527-N7)-methyltransferase
MIRRVFAVHQSEACFAATYKFQGMEQSASSIMTAMETLRKQIEQLAHIQLTDKRIALFQQYEDLLVEWSQKFNLTAIQEPEAIRIKHFLDSLSCMLAIHGSEFHRVIDIGTGAGFPGIPLKIAYPSIQLTLVEATGKKAKFCELVISTLGLTDVEVVKARSEELAHLAKYRESYDWALARAVANLPTLLEYILPFVKVGGSVLAQKGVTAYQETQTATHAIQVLGGELKNIQKVELPGVTDDHFLVVIKKIHPTPLLYPRAAGQPVKKPIL